MAQPVYSFNIATGAIVPGGVTLLPLDPAYRWVLRDIDGTMDNPSQLDFALDVLSGTVVIVRFVCPPNGVVTMHWRGRIIIPDLPGPPSLQLTCSGDPAANANYTINGYRLQP